MYVVEVSYVRRECGVKRWEGESNERCDMGSSAANGNKCGVMEWVGKKNFWSYKEKKE